MSTQERLREEAQAIARHLAKRRDITAVLLHGSVARRDADDDSDIDLLVVGQRPATTSSRLRQALDLEASGTRLSLVFHTPESLRDAFAEGSRIELQAGRLSAYDRPEVFGGRLLFPLSLQRAVTCGSSCGART